MLDYRSHPNTKYLIPCEPTSSPKKAYKLDSPVLERMILRQQLQSTLSQSIMIFVKILFCLLYCSLSFKTARGQSNTAKNTPDTSTSSKCHNVHFNNYYSGPANKDIKAHLLKIENQLAELEKKIDALTGNKTTLPGEFLSILYIRLTTHLCWNISC